MCRVKGAVVAVPGEVNPSVLDKFEVRMPAAAFELDLASCMTWRGRNNPISEWKTNLNKKKKDRTKDHCAATAIGFSF